MDIDLLKKGVEIGCAVAVDRPPIIVIIASACAIFSAIMLIGVHYRLGRMK